MKVLPTMGSMYSGSLRGITASHNKGGLYFRGRTIPTNPNTSRQQVMRSIVQGLMDAWSNELSDAQREAWRSYGQNVDVVDSLGQTMQLSGINWYVGANAARLQVREFLDGTFFDRVDDAPVIFNRGPGIQSVGTFEGTFTTPPGTVDIAGNFDAETVGNHELLVYVAPPQTSGTRFYKGPYQLAASSAVVLGAASTFSITGIDLADSGDWSSDIVPVAGWDELYVPLKLVLIQQDGRYSSPWRMLVQFSDVTP